MAIARVFKYFRERFHPLFYLRKSSLGRSAIRMLDHPVWLSMPGVTFKVRGLLITHGLAFAAAGSQEPGVEALALTCLERLKLKSFWDVGANIGYYTWLLKSASPQLRAVMFEAFPLNANLIQATLRRERLPDVEVIAAGASDVAGRGSLRTDEFSGATSTLDDSPEETFQERHWGVKSKKLEIALTTIDEEAAHSGGQVDLIKIDVEGHEAAVLRGARNTIHSGQPIVFIECFHSGHPCLLPLEEHGYRFVDAERLGPAGPETTNYFGFPPGFHDRVDELLAEARQRIQP